MSALVVVVVDEDQRAIAGQPLPGRRRELTQRGQSRVSSSKSPSDVATVAELGHSTEVTVLG